MEIELPYGPAIPLLGIHTEETRKRHVYPNVHCSTVYNSRTWKQPRCPSADEWIRKLWYIYTMEYSVQFTSVAQSCPTLCDTMDYTVHGILQARIPEWVAFPFSRGSSQPRSPALRADSLPAEPYGKPKNIGVGRLALLQDIFPTQELNSDLLHCRWILYQLSYQGLIHSLQFNMQHLPRHPNGVSIINTWPLNII